MNRLSRLLILVLVTIKSQICWSDCIKINERRGNINFQVHESSYTGQCFYSISPLKVNNLKYRNYSFSSDGVFLIFSSYGPGEESKNTGAREIYFFPRSKSLSYFFNDEFSRLEVQNVNGDQMYFDYETAELIGSNKGVVAVSPEVKIGDRGGIEFLSYDGLLMDAGFEVGNIPTVNPSRSSVFRDSDANKCKLNNRQMFIYPSEDDVEFKFPTDLKLQEFLKIACPNLITDFMTK